ncbi:MAG: DUF3592 domain-containing protein [Oscillospiraceae bacterium]|nr:DUF3592 domain-containing protein [Oscillospiraceae bacterium]
MLKLTRNPFTTASLTVLVMGIVFFTVGISIPLLMLKERDDFMKTAVKADAVITGIYTSGSGDDKTHTVGVRFYDKDGNEIDTTLSHYSSDMYAGMGIEVWYDPDNPRSIMSGSLIFPIILLCIFGTIGMVMLFFGIRNLSRTVGKAALRNRLESEGYYVTANVIEHGVMRNTRINGYYPFMIRCDYSEGGQTYEFTEKFLNDDPAPCITADGKIRVYVDRRDFKNYCIDLKTLPEKQPGAYAQREPYAQQEPYTSYSPPEKDRETKNDTNRLIMGACFLGMVVLSAVSFGVRVLLPMLPFIVFGGGMFFGAVRKIYGRAKSRETGERLIAEGCFIMADVVEIRQSADGSFIVGCRYFDAGGTVYEYRKTSLKNDPAPYITPDNKIRVYVDRNDYKIHHMELS